MSTIQERQEARAHETYAAVARAVRTARAAARRVAREDRIGPDALAFVETRCTYAAEQRAGLREYLARRREAVPEGVTAKRPELPEARVYKLKNWNPAEWKFHGFED